MQIQANFCVEQNYQIFNVSKTMDVICSKILYDDDGRIQLTMRISHLVLNIFLCLAVQEVAYKIQFAPNRLSIILWIPIQNHEIKT